VSETDDCSVSNDLLLHMQCKKFVGRKVLRTWIEDC